MRSSTKLKNDRIHVIQDGCKTRNLPGWSCHQESQSKAIPRWTSYYLPAVVHSLGVGFHWPSLPSFFLFFPIPQAPGPCPGGKSALLGPGVWRFRICWCHCSQWHFPEETTLISKSQLKGELVTVRFLSFLLQITGSVRLLVLYIE